jgi:hypothetical protein
MSTARPRARVKARTPEGGQEEGSGVPQRAVVEEDAIESKKSSSPQSERSDSPTLSTSLPLPTHEPKSEVEEDDYQSMLSRATALMVLPAHDDEATHMTKGDLQ